MQREGRFGRPARIGKSALAVISVVSAQAVVDARSVRTVFPAPSSQSGSRLGRPDGRASGNRSRSGSRSEAIPTPAPIFVVQNQQERRWVQTALVTVEADGDAFYAERSSVKLQAPYFNFRRYPFDHQVFFYEVRSVVPDTFIELTPMEELWGFGDLLGEEEWILENPRLIASVEPGLTGQESSQVALRFEGRRHIEYYALRLFLPLLVLIVVAWATFFLEQYQRRIEIAGANLLVFVAFNFAISDSLPRLGYTTFLDFILQWMFLVTGAVIVVNVALRRLEIDGHEALARRIDNWVIKWIYPLGYAAIIGFAVYSFLLN
jgi:hypothetical protein